MASKTSVLRGIILWNCARSISSHRHFLRAKTKKLYFYEKLIPSLQCTLQVDFFYLSFISIYLSFWIILYLLLEGSELLMFLLENLSQLLWCIWRDCRIKLLQLSHQLRSGKNSGILHSTFTKGLLVLMDLLDALLVLKLFKLLFYRLLGRLRWWWRWWGWWRWGWWWRWLLLLWLLL